MNEAKDPFRGDRLPIGVLYFFHFSFSSFSTTSMFRLDRTNNEEREDDGNVFVMYSLSRHEVVAMTEDHAVEFKATKDFIVRALSVF